MIKLYDVLLGVLVLAVIAFFLMDNKKGLEKNAIVADGNINPIVKQEGSISDAITEVKVRVHAEIVSRFSEISLNNRVVSESLSYSMLIAVLSNDRDAFDKNWSWAKKNLQVRPGDKLFSWLWQNGKVSDINPATDADQDIAYALYLAYKQWGDDAYLRSSLEIVRDIWKAETEQIQDARYVGAGNWAVNDSDGVIINPSYLAPYQYRVFAEIDPEHDWMGLVDSSYKTLNLCTGGVGLAQDWCKIDNQGNVVKNFRLSKNDSSVYSYDALRVPYRVSMDYALNNDPRAIEYLRRNKVFIESWKKNGKIFSVYNQQGRYVGKGESLASYGAQLASMSLIDKDVAQDIFEKKIAKIESFKGIGFYDLSWLWFGSHFYLEVLNKEAGV